MTTVPETSGNGLLTALLAVQAEAPTLPKDATNPFYKSRYTPLDTIVETVGPILNRNGLMWITLPGIDPRGEPCLEYRLVHTSGDSITGFMPLLLSEQTPQSMGSAITYARRYSLCAVLNLVADDDDDGNAAGQSSGQTSSAKPSTGQLDFLKKIVTGKARGIPKPTTAQLNVLLSRVESTVRVEEGWTGRLTRQECSNLLDKLTKEPLPDTDHPSDIPPDDAPSHPEVDPDPSLPFNGEQTA